MTSVELGTTARVRVAGALCLLTLVWLPVHFVLVSRFDVDPWKLGGMAMYCTSHDTTLHFEYRAADGFVRPLLLDSLSPDLRMRAERHYHRRATLGRLYSLEPLANEMLAARSVADELILRTSVTRLDATGELRRTEQVHRYRRD